MGAAHLRAGLLFVVEEVSAARIYGELHYRNSTVVGRAMGKKIGELTVQNYQKPAH